MGKPKRNKWNDPKSKRGSPAAIAAQDRAKAERNFAASKGVPLAELIKRPILADSPHVERHTWFNL